MSNKSSSPGSGSELSPKERGRRAFQAGRFAEAIKYWSGIAEPDRSLKQALAEAHFRQAAALHLDATTLPHLHSATKLLDSDPVYAYWYAVGLHKSGRIKEALAEYQRAESLGLAAAPGAAQRNPQLSVWLAQRSGGPLENWPELSAKAGDPQHATSRMVFDALTFLKHNDEEGNKKAVTQLGSMSPKFLPREVGAQRYAYLGVAHARRGNTTAAFENWRLAARTWPAHRLVQHNLASTTLTQLREALDRNDMATVQTLVSGVSKQDLALMSALRGLRYDMALAFARDKKWDEAVEQLTLIDTAMQDVKAAERRPILHDLALLSEMAEDWSSAAESWRGVLQALPRGKKAASEAGLNDQRKWIRKRAIDCYKRADELDQAIRVLRQTVKQDPNDLETRLDLVRALYANDQEQAAEKEAQRLLETDPNHIETLLQLGEMQLESGKYSRATQNLEHALSLAPDDRRVRTGLAEVLHQSAHEEEHWGQPERAIANFERAMQFAPEDLGLMGCAARSYASSGKLDKAREVVGRMIQAGKGTPEAYVKAADFWAGQNDTAGVDSVLKQAEQAGALNAYVLGMTGMNILDNVYPEAPSFLFDLARRYGMASGLVKSQLGRRPTKPTDPKLRDYAHSLLTRAMQFTGATTEQLMPAFVPLVTICPQEALPYVTWMADHMPNDPMSALMLGCTLAIQKQTKAAESAFEKARTLAKAAHDTDTEQMAREFKTLAHEPEFAEVMGQMFNAAGRGGEFDLEGILDGLDDDDDDD